MGYNQADLAEALGVTFQQVQKYEKGANRVSASRLWDISRFLEIEIGYVFKGLEDVEEPGPGVKAEVPEAPLNRTTTEISRLAPKMSVARQKMVLELCRSLREANDDVDGEQTSDEPERTTRPRASEGSGRVAVVRKPTRLSSPASGHPSGGGLRRGGGR